MEIFPHLIANGFLSVNKESYIWSQCSKQPMLEIARLWGQNSKTPELIDEKIGVGGCIHNIPPACQNSKRLPHCDINWGHSFQKISRLMYIAYNFGVAWVQFSWNHVIRTGPLHAAHWALPYRLQKPGFGNQVWGPDPPESKFKFLTLRLPPVLWPTFLVAPLACCEARLNQSGCLVSVCRHFFPTNPYLQAGLTDLDEIWHEGSIP